MKKPIQRFFYFFPPLALAGFVLFLWWKGVSANTETISGTVVDDHGPIAGARVRIRATENMTLTNNSGEFTLMGLIAGESVELTAWADGYYVANTYVTPTVTDINLTLRPYHTSDHPDYDWVSPIAGTSDSACGNCHPMILPQWENNAHGGAIANNRFYSLYNGTNLSGTASIGPGYLNDFPGTSGVCANCHAPGAGVDGYLTTNMNTIRNDLTSGIHCDFCHKVGGAYLNSATGSVYPNSPGVSSLRVLRPPEGDQIFFGPYDDIHDPDTYLPLISESQFCAACHQFSFWGIPIYESYEEWLASDYAEDGVTCQNCHMPPNGDTFFASPEIGGLEHPPEKIPSHLQLGARNIELLENTVSMNVSAKQTLNRIWVTATITNTGAGHHIPTDFPGRQMLLVVTATDSEDQPLTQLSGYTVPVWGGQQAGMAGTGFAKVLQDVETGQNPVVSYWKQTLIISDNRIPALATNVTSYSFMIPPGVKTGTITARLIFRRVFQTLAEQKEWDLADILMAERALTITFQSTHSYFLPLIVDNTYSK